MVILNEAELIRAIRDRLGLNQTELATRLGIKQTTVSQYETGRSAVGKSVLLLLRELAETEKEKRSVNFWLGANQPPVEEPASPNVITQIRQAAQMSVVDFADALRVSQMDVAAFEYGDIPPPAVIRRLQTIATKAGHADLALILSSDEWKVRVFYPGETLISSGKGKLPPHVGEGGVFQGDGYSPERPHAIFVSGDEILHVEKLLRVLRSGHRKPAQAVIENLDTFFDFCELADNAAASAAPGRGAGAGKTEAPHRPLAGDLPGQREKRRTESPGRVRPRKRA